jgi:hypothetical protein
LIILKEGTSVGQVIKEKATFLATYNLRIGPHVVILVHDDNLSTASFYVVIQGGLLYKVSSLLEAVDIAIKSSFVFNIQYSACAVSSWLFLQRMVFGIELAADAMSTKLNALLIDTRKELK